MGIVISWVVAGALVAPRPNSAGDPPSDINAHAIALSSKSGSSVAGWNCRNENRKGVVVLVHGIRGSRVSMLDRARMLYADGYSAVMIDLQAHGESTGEAITVGHREQHDVRAAIQFARHQYPGQPVGLIGVSLGGASALLGSPLSIDAMVLESVFPNLRDAVHNRVAGILGPLSWVPAELLLVQLKPRLGIDVESVRPIDHIREVGCPVYVISGTLDCHTTADETESMFATAREPKRLWLVEGAAHQDLMQFDRAKYSKQVLAFFDQYLAQPTKITSNSETLNRR